MLLPYGWWPLSRHGVCPGQQKSLTLSVPGGVHTLHPDKRQTSSRPHGAAVWVLQESGTYISQDLISPASAHAPGCWSFASMASSVGAFTSEVRPQPSAEGQLGKWFHPPEPDTWPRLE